MSQPPVPAIDFVFRTIGTFHKCFLVPVSFIKISWNAGAITEHQRRHRLSGHRNHHCFVKQSTLAGTSESSLFCDAVVDTSRNFGVITALQNRRALKAQTMLKNEQNVGFRCGLREKHSLAD
ncbi:hypothetical protein TNCV_154211 [Trichonephila clavipes]|nr:hypothetical protein TNCV_154211 [Trichonephila clavipes]